MNKKLDKLLKELEKKYNAKKATQIVEDEIIRTGIYALDYVLSGGIHQCEGGHRIEFLGAESSGKTTFALHVIKKYQELGKTCVFIDAENSYDKEWAEIIGIDNDNLLIVKPKSLEEAGDLFVKLIPEADLIVADSIVAFIPEDEIDRDTNEPTMGLQARVNALICRKIYRAISGRKTTLLFMNQRREKIGVRYGNPYTTGGGRALKHMYNTRIEFYAGASIFVDPNKKTSDKIGVEISLTCIKNKKGVPKRKATMDFYFTGNIDNKKGLFFGAIKYGIIELSGKTYTYKKKKAVGQKKAIKMLTDADYKAIEEEIWTRQK